MMTLIDYISHNDQSIQSVQSTKQLMSIDEITQRIRTIRHDIQYARASAPAHKRSQPYDTNTTESYGIYTATQSHHRSISAPCVMNPHSTGTAIHKPLLQKYMTSRVGYNTRYRIDNNKL